MAVLGEGTGLGEEGCAFASVCLFLWLLSQSLEELPAGSVAKEVIYMSVC